MRPSISHSLLGCTVKLMPARIDRREGESTSSARAQPPILETTVKSTKSSCRQVRLSRQADLRSRAGSGFSARKDFSCRQVLRGFEEFARQVFVWQHRKKCRAEPRDTGPAGLRESDSSPAFQRTTSLPDRASLRARQEAVCAGGGCDQGLGVFERGGFPRGHCRGSARR